MNQTFTHSLRIRWIALAACLFLFCGASVYAGDLKLEAQLIWATDQVASPNPKHKPAQDWVETKLRKSGFKWEHYFEVNKASFSVPQDDSSEVVLSKHWTITVHNLGNDMVEMSLSGKGKPVGKIKQLVPKGQLLVVGGNAENLTAWFVVLRQVE